MTRSAIGVRLCLAAAGLAAGLSAAAAQSTGPPRPPLLIASMYGADLYRHYCAPCHGREGRGDGPAAAALKAKASDLTRLAARHGGEFPKAHVEGVLREGPAVPPVPAHGSREMPVWGPIFRALDDSDARADERVANLVEYVASLQVK